MSATSPTIRATRTSDIQAAAQHARQGGLVALPTETVYGLGCHALNEAAIQAVFDAKERPLTDPLIVHVLESTEAYQLWEAGGEELSILKTLCDTFWPGPLTLVAKANDSVPKKLMAGTGFVAVRSPSHTIARSLLRAANIPMAAPSANKFGHVSPTTADHVFDDLKLEDVWILESSDDAPCHVGVESSVVKLETINGSFVLTMLRQGAISKTDLEQALTNVSNVSVRSEIKRATTDMTPNVAPGQTIRHYSPNIPSYMVSSHCPFHDKLKDAVVVDYQGRLAKWKIHVREYRDLGASSNVAAQNVFETLRWAERIPFSNYILFPQIIDHDHSADALTLALNDRLTRAASGVVIESLDDV